MKILLLGDASNYHATLATALKAKGHDVTLASDQATGEIMAIAPSFEAGMMKAVRSIELGMDTMTKEDFVKLTDEEVLKKLEDIDVDRSFCVF